MRYQNVRLSPHFVLMDFMYGWEVYSSRLRLPLEDSISEENIRAGVALCANMLEPMTARWGPSSTSFGLIPQAVADHHRWTDYRPRPHRWNDEFGAAADLCFHDAAHDGIAPVDLCRETERWMEYERLITYGGSEFICINWREGERRFAFYENERRPGDKHKFRTIGKGWEARDLRTNNITPHPLSVEEWQRKEGELTGSNRIRAQHIRVGQYFTLLDFCRSELGLAMGLSPVPVKWGGHEVKVARMFAEVLDGLTQVVGRLSVVKGIQPTALAIREGNELYNWAKEQDTYAVKFLLPQGMALETGDYDWCGPHILSVETAEHASDTLQVTMQIMAFEPRFTGTVGGF